MDCFLGLLIKLANYYSYILGNLATIGLAIARLADHMVSFLEPSSPPQSHDNIN